MSNTSPSNPKPSTQKDNQSRHPPTKVFETKSTQQPKELGRNETHQWIGARKQYGKILLLPERQCPDILPGPLASDGIEVVYGGCSKDVEDN
jgi:hypothetical protein